MKRTKKTKQPQPRKLTSNPVPFGYQDWESYFTHMAMPIVQEKLTPAAWKTIVYLAAHEYACLAQECRELREDRERIRLERDQLRHRIDSAPLRWIDCNWRTMERPGLYVQKIGEYLIPVRVIEETEAK